MSEDIVAAARGPVRDRQVRGRAGSAGRRTRCSASTTSIFRPHNVYGEHQNIGDRYRNVIGIFMNQIMQGEPMTIFGDGDADARVQLHRRRRAASSPGASISAAARNEVFNIGADVPYSVRDLADGRREGVRRRAAGRAPRGAATRSSTRSPTTPRRNGVFGPGSHVGLEEGIARMAAWARGGRRAGEQGVQRHRGRAEPPGGLEEEGLRPGGGHEGGAGPRPARVRILALVRDQHAHVRPVEKAMGETAEFVFDETWNPLDRRASTARSRGVRQRLAGRGRLVSRRGATGAGSVARPPGRDSRVAMPVRESALRRRGRSAPASAGPRRQDRLPRGSERAPHRLVGKRGQGRGDGNATARPPSRPFLRRPIASPGTGSWS